jgi:hypothetical protein
VVAKEKLDLTEPADSYKRYFSFVKGDKKAHCRLCTKQISRDRASTKGMMEHLKSKLPLHQVFYKELVAAKKQSSVAVCGQPSDVKRPCPVSSCSLMCNKQCAITLVETTKAGRNFASSF